MWFKRDHLPFIVILIFLIMQIAIISKSPPLWWDEAVYYGMGKVIWSLGEAGLWEAARPLTLPAFLGFFWLGLGNNSILLLQILMAGISCGCLLLLYIIAKEMLGWKTAMIAMTLTAFSFTYLTFGAKLLTGIPALALFLAGILLWRRERYLLSGILLGLAALTRFFELLPIALFGLAVLIIWDKDWEQKAKAIASMIGGFAIVTIPYLLLNAILYQDLLRPFIIQYFLTTQTGIPYTEPWHFYILSLIRESPLLLLGMTIPFLIKKRDKKALSIIAFIGIGMLVIHSLASHKEMRLILPAIPFLAILAGYAIVRMWENKESLLKKFVVVFLAVLWAASLTGSFPSLLETPDIPQTQIFFQERMEQTQGSLWISSPKYAIYSDKQISGLLYYPEVPQELPNIVFIDWCDLNGNSQRYFAILRERLTTIQKELENMYSIERDGCLTEIYQRKT